MAKYLLSIFFFLWAFFVSLDITMATESQDISVITNCSGVQVVRTSAGQFEVRHVESNLPGCINSQGVTETVSPTIIATTTNVVSTGATSESSWMVFVWEATLILPGIDLSHGPLLDLASTDIVKYRIEQLKEKSIRFANVLRSVRMRRAASMQSETRAYLMNNSAVIISGKETGWVKVQWADIEVTDIQENVVSADTTGKASGYTASKYLRDPNANDLVRVEQADQAYWSDVASVNVGLANIRSNPWYTAPIVTTLPKGTSLYVVATVDNWSEVRNDEGTIKGYIRSDLLKITHAQRVDNPNTGKVITPTVTHSETVNTETSSTPTESGSVDTSWIGF